MTKNGVRRRNDGEVLRLRTSSMSRYRLLCLSGQLPQRPLKCWNRGSCLRSVRFIQSKARVLSGTKSSRIRWVGGDNRGGMNWCCLQMLTLMCRRKVSDVGNTAFEDKPLLTLVALADVGYACLTGELSSKGDRENDIWR